MQTKCLHTRLHGVLWCANSLGEALQVSQTMPPPPQNKVAALFSTSPLLWGKEDWPICEFDYNS